LANDENVVLPLKFRDEVQAVIFDKKDGETLVLLVQKMDEKKRLHWRLLKGGVNEGETKVEALKREILEETSLRKLEVLAEVHNYEFTSRDTKHRVSSFLVKVNMKEPIKLQESELAGCAWMGEMKAMQLLYWHNEKEAVKKLSQFYGRSGAATRTST
jgi:ADP-ribose pyrophosphatase YjhB (NUDIX family)